MSNKNKFGKIKRVTVARADKVITREGRTDCTECTSNAELAVLSEYGSLKLCESCWQDLKTDVEDRHNCRIEEVRI